MQSGDRAATEAGAEGGSEITIEFDSKDDRALGFYCLLMESNSQFSSMGDTFTVTAGQCRMLDGKGIKYRRVPSSAAPSKAAA